MTTNINTRLLLGYIRNNPDVGEIIARFKTATNNISNGNNMAIRNKCHDEIVALFKSLEGSYIDTTNDDQVRDEIAEFIMAIPDKYITK